jgi:hypothetical protein
LPIESLDALAVDALTIESLAVDPFTIESLLGAVETCAAKEVAAAPPNRRTSVAPRVLRWLVDGVDICAAPFAELEMTA